MGLGFEGLGLGGSCAGSSGIYGSMLTGSSLKRSGLLGQDNSLQSIFLPYAWHSASAKASPKEHPSRVARRQAWATKRIEIILQIAHSSFQSGGCPAHTPNIVLSLS